MLNFAVSIYTFTESILLNSVSAEIDLSDITDWGFSILSFWTDTTVSTSTFSAGFFINRIVSAAGLFSIFTVSSFISFFKITAESFFRTRVSELFLMFIVSLIILLLYLPVTVSLFCLWSSIWFLFLRDYLVLNEVLLRQSLFFS